MPKVTAKQLTDRRALVRTLRIRGLNDDGVLKVLEQEGYLDGYSKMRHRQLKMLREDRKVLLEEDKQRFSVDGEDAKSAREDYISRLLDLFRAAFTSKQYATARLVAKDIAMQFGIPTEEALQIKHEGTIEHVHSIVSLIKEYNPDNRIAKELEAITVG